MSICIYIVYNIQNPANYGGACMCPYVQKIYKNQYLQLLCYLIHI